MDIAWKKLKEVPKKSGYRKLFRRTFLLPNGKKAIYDVYNEATVVCILALTKSGEVVLAKQFRAGPEKVLYELPGGFIDPGELPQHAAERELLEETGYKGKLQFVGTSYQSGYSTMIRYNFVALNCERVAEPVQDGEEFTEVFLMPLEDFREHLRSGELTDISSGYLGLDYLNLL